MKKMLLVVAVLLMAVPAMATVTITATQVTGSYMVDIGYDSTSESQLARAFALDVTVDNGATILDVNQFKVGESNEYRVGGTAGYGIFPGTIDINSTTWKVDHYGTPVAPVTDPGALDGLTTAGVTLEMGSLYKDKDNNAPATIGKLCRIKVSGACNMTINTNATRGNVVMEDVTTATTNLPITFEIVPAGCTVPNVVGMTQADATTAITNAGFVVSVSNTGASDTVAVGSVMAQDKTGSQTCGITVTITVVCHRVTCATCLGDINNDGWRRTNDLGALITLLNTAGSPYRIPSTSCLYNPCADLNSDGTIRTNDLGALITMLNAIGSPYRQQCP